MYQSDRAPTILPPMSHHLCRSALSEVLDSITGTRQSIPMEAYTLIVGLYNPAGQSEAWSCDISHTFTRQYIPMEAH